ncbi:hypothetical protein Aph02nite_66110 [Actinoplanes philippinensis]|uniref:Uncharacterized protein n=1 Tax=Actinoplanes philippinensis TaxID=35752 RepID=A0A1I2L0U9_9ACTN|nr:hypothetical protein [Actinoplanes philippinensis]GIE80661.1 hypothetical protein Aph02nite_66110 [Actinoplanes philippinensis]SFF72924.1 hypothetical protein SAMN05421541_119133 [Actinoplanes philippinensis]
MERNDGQRPRLRIAGYVSGHAEPVAGEEPAPVAEPGPTPRPLPVRLPDISDYWPDRDRRTQAGEAPGSRPPRRRKRPVVAAGLLAGLVITGTLLLTRPEDETPAERLAAPATVPASAAAPASVEPTESPTPESPTPEPPSPPPATTVPPPITTARFVLTSGVTELDVRAADLGGDAFQVTTPKDSGLDVNADFENGVLSVSAKPDGRKNGSGKVDVRLSKDVVWRLRMGAGVRTASFDMSGGTVSDIDLIGGARTIDIELGRLDRTLPILMAGGVQKWRIRTAGKVPVRVALSSGAGGVTLYGNEKGGVSAGVSVGRGDLDDEPGLDIDAEAGMGSLDISRD